jgi:tetratricopeptide (TPR) repeat protein
MKKKWIVVLVIIAIIAITLFVLWYLDVITFDNALVGTLLPGVVIPLVTYVTDRSSKDKSSKNGNNVLNDVIKDLLKDKKDLQQKLKESNDELETYRISQNLNQVNAAISTKEAEFELLEKTINANTNPSEINANAAKLLDEGKLAEAQQILLLAKDKQDEQAAYSHVMLAQTFALQNNYPEAETHYRKAVDIYPSFFNLSVLAAFYHQQRDYKNAEIYLQQCSPLAHNDEEKAGILNNLGTLLYDINDYDAARKAYEDALEISRKLAEVNPAAYEPDVAMTLNNLGNLFSDNNDDDAARKAYEEALEIRRKLATVNTAAYEPNVAMTLNNLGTLLYDINDYDAARKAYEEALEISRKLAMVNPAAYEPDLATTLNNLGELLRGLNDYDAARKAFEEALEIYQRFAERYPQAFQPDVDMVKDNIAELEQQKAARQE